MINPFKRLSLPSSASSEAKTKPVFMVVVTNDTQAGIPYVSSKEPRYSIHPVTIPKLLNPGDVLEGIKMTVDASTQSMTLECPVESGELYPQKYIFSIEGVAWNVQAKV